MSGAFFVCSACNGGGLDRHCVCDEPRERERGEGRPLNKGARLCVCDTDRAGKRVVGV